MQGLHFITRQTKFRGQLNGEDQSTINQTTHIHRCAVTKFVFDQG
jgi:hypothetical protein